MKSYWFLFYLVGTVLVAGMCARSVEGRSKIPSKAEYIVYVGTTRNGKGIFASRFDSATGKLASPDLVAETVNPSCLAIHPNNRFLYAVNETSNFQEQKSGSVSSFAIDRKTGQLTLLNQVASRGTPPGQLIVDGTGENVLVGHYGSGSVAVFPIKDDGSLAEASAFIQLSGSGPNPKRQRGPHAESINLSPDNRFAILTDLGQDKLFVYRFNSATGSLEANDPPFAVVHPGAGPRRLAFDPHGRFAYVINELDSTITTFAYDSPHGELTELETVSTLPTDFSGSNSAAEVRVHPSGKFLYASNRGHDSIAVYSINAHKGTLTFIEHVPVGGKTPRSFSIDPSGSFLLVSNQDSNTVVEFTIDQKTGRLTSTNQVLDIGSPVGVTFFPLR